MSTLSVQTITGVTTFDFANTNFASAYGTANSGYVVANAAFGKANTALQNTTGTSGGYVTSGYTGGTQYLGIGTATLSAGFDINGNFNNAGNAFTGHFIFTLAGSNIWVCSSVVFSSGAGTQPNLLAGYISLGGTLTQLRITTVNGTDTFDAGLVNMFYEG